jgi:uncharacterized membrane protein YidH (DUF202 family)
VSHVDPGLQAQRTALAWTRTGLSVLLNAVVVLRSGVQADEPFILGLGFMLLVAAAVAVGCGGWRARRLTIDVTHSAPPTIVVAGIVGVAFVACIGGLASIVFTRT